MSIMRFTYTAKTNISNEYFPYDDDIRFMDWLSDSIYSDKSLYEFRQEYEPVIENLPIEKVVVGISGDPINTNKHDANLDVSVYLNDGIDEELWWDEYDDDSIIDNESFIYLLEGMIFPDFVEKFNQICTIIFPIGRYADARNWFDYIRFNENEFSIVLNERDGKFDTYGAKTVKFQLVPEFESHF